ncbi:putative transmembrane protein [Toxoplasma gondii VAND]|uniref:Putative transmembrane protein n=1 Tax=Toxoplasma gondii VAND TaxID=933077 RepID=A0A086QJI0_TOXGO|nr:putative transmembrane protein [Toxoplasma gondii VAND]
MAKGTSSFGMYPSASVRELSKLAEVERLLGRPRPRSATSPGPRNVLSNHRTLCVSHCVGHRGLGCPAPVTALSAKQSLLLLLLCLLPVVVFASLLSHAHVDCFSSLSDDACKRPATDTVNRYRMLARTQLKNERRGNFQKNKGEKLRFLGGQTGPESTVAPSSFSRRPVSPEPAQKPALLETKSNSGLLASARPSSRSSSNPSSSAASSLTLAGPMSVLSGSLMSSSLDSLIPEIGAREDELRRARLEAQGFILTEPPVSRHEKTVTYPPKHGFNQVSTALAMRHEQTKLHAEQAATSDNREKTPARSGAGTPFSQGRKENRIGGEKRKQMPDSNAASRPSAQQSPAPWLDRPFVSLAASAAQAALAAAAAAVRGELSVGSDSSSSQSLRNSGDESAGDRLAPKKSGSSPANALESVNEKLEDVLSHVVEFFTGGGTSRGSPGAHGSSAEHTVFVGEGASSEARDQVGFSTADKEEGTGGMEKRKASSLDDENGQTEVQVMGEASMTMEVKDRLPSHTKGGGATSRSHGSGQHSLHHSSSVNMEGMEEYASETNSRVDGGNEETLLDDDGEELFQRVHRLTKTPDVAPSRQRVKNAADTHSFGGTQTPASVDEGALVGERTSAVDQEKGVEGQELGMREGEERFLNRQSGIRLPLDTDTRIPEVTLFQADGNPREGVFSWQTYGKRRKLSGVRRNELRAVGPVSTEGESESASQGAETGSSEKDTSVSSQEVYGARAVEATGGQEQVHANWLERHQRQRSTGETSGATPPPRQEAETKPFREPLFRESATWQVPDKESTPDNPQKHEHATSARPNNENSKEEETRRPRPRKTPEGIQQGSGRRFDAVVLENQATGRGDELSLHAPDLRRTEEANHQVVPHRRDEEGASPPFQKAEGISTFPLTAGFVGFLTEPTDVNIDEWERMEMQSSTKSRLPGETPPHVALPSYSAHLANTKGTRRHGSSARTSGTDRLYPQFVAADTTQDSKGSAGIQGPDVGLRMEQSELLTDGENDEPVGLSALERSGISEQVVDAQKTQSVKPYETTKEKEQQLEEERETGPGSVDAHVGAQIGSAAAAAATSFAEKLLELDWEKLALENPTVNKVAPLFNYLLGQGGSSQGHRVDHQRHATAVTNSAAALPPALVQPVDLTGRLTSGPLLSGQRAPIEQPGVEPDQMKPRGFSWSPATQLLGAGHGTETVVQEIKAEPSVSAGRLDTLGLDRPHNAASATAVFGPLPPSHHSTAGQGQTDSVATLRSPLAVGSNLQPLRRIMGLRSDSLGPILSVSQADPARPDLQSAVVPIFTNSNVSGQGVDRGMTLDDGAVYKLVAVPSWPGSFAGLNGRGILQAASTLLKGV